MLFCEARPLDVKSASPPLSDCLSLPGLGWQVHTTMPSRSVALTGSHGPEESDFFLFNFSQNRRSRAQRVPAPNILRAPGEATTAYFLGDAGCQEAEEPFVLRWDSGILAGQLLRSWPHHGFNSLAGRLIVGLCAIQVVPAHRVWEHSRRAPDAPPSWTSRVMDLDRLRWKWPEALPGRFLHNRTS